MKATRKNVLGTAVLLIFAGIIFISSANIPVEEVIVNREEVNHVDGQWNITAWFNEGEKLLLLPAPPTGTSPIWGAYFNISIVDPHGNETIFRLEFPTAWEINLSVVKNEGGLEVNKDSPYLGGITQYEGNYTAFVDKAAMLWYGGGPPTYLTFYKEIEERQTTYPYRILMPAGIVMVFTGLCLPLWTVIKGRKKKTHRYHSV